MGFFDKVAKAAKAVGDFLDDRTDTAQQLNGSNGSDAAVKNDKTDTYKTPADIIASGNAAPKPDVRFGFDYYGGDVDRLFSFKASGDFVDFSIANKAGYDGVCIYSPNKTQEEIFEIDNRDYKELLGYPMIFSYTICEDDVIYEAIDNFKSGSAQSEEILELTPINSGRTFFKAKGIVNQGYNIGYFYCFDLSEYDECHDHCVFGVMYSKDVVGTALEKKLTDQVDKAYSSYEIIDKA